MPRPLRERQQFGTSATTSRKSRRDGRHARKFVPQGTAGLTSMPGEILFDLVQYLHLPDLEALSVTCKHFHDVFSANLTNEQAFARAELSDVTLSSDNYGYHDLLMSILKREVNPNYIKRFDCRRACHSRRTFGYLDEGDEIEVARYIGWTPEDISLVRATISRSPWLESIISAEELIHEMLHENEDAVLALLVPLMKNLSLFLPPRDASLLRLVFVKIARAQIVAELTNPPAWQRLPLRRLHTIFASGHLGIMPLFDTVHYMSLPSVRRIFHDGVSYEGPEHRTRAKIRSLSGIPRSRASVVYIRCGAVWRNMAEVFVEFLEGPCVLRQYMDEPVPTDAELQEPWVVADWVWTHGPTAADPISYHWDHCIINPGQGNRVTVPSVRSKDRATQASKEPDGRSVEFMLKYRAFHYDSVWEGNLNEYEAEIRQTGIVPSPQWLALANWAQYCTHPENLDDDSFVLED